LRCNKLFETAFYSLSIKPLPIICNSAEWRVVVHADVITCVCVCVCVFDCYAEKTVPHAPPHRRVVLTSGWYC